MEPKYKRVLLKISGEALAGDKGFGLDEPTINKICRNIKKIVDMGVQVSIVVGGGNIWRGRSGENMDRTRADHMGMLATAINALALASGLETSGVQTRVQTAIEMRQIAEPYIRGRAERHLEKGRVVVFGCGTGNPFMSTDTAAALRAVEMDAQVILLAKKVDAVYDSDPNVNPDAKKFDTLSFSDVLSKNLGVMDSTAASMCRDNNMPILVFGLNDPENIVKAISGERIGTLVNNSGKFYSQKGRALNMGKYPEVEAKMEKRINGYANELKTIRAGRANASVLDKIAIDYYGTMTPVGQVGSISSPDPRQLVIQPWDGSVLKEIEKAINASDLGIAPQNDGKVIRLNFPPLTEERRKELVKQVKKYTEEAKVQIRNARRDAMDDYKAKKKKGEITEDDLKSTEKDIQNLTDKYIKEIDKISSDKEKEILEV